MRYKVYYRTDDPYANWEAFNVGSARDRDEELAQMVASAAFREIRYCKLYADGSEGDFVKVFTNRAN